MGTGAATKLIATILLICSLGGAAALSPLLSASAGRHELDYTDTAEEGDPPQVAAGIAMGAFRGLFVNYLWMRANELKEEGRFHESVELARAITKLQPRFPRVWAFHAWNLSYNISVATQTPEERWRWVTAGVDLLKEEGIPANPNDMLLHKELAWIYLHKIGGYTDDSNRYYKREIAERWTNILGEPPMPGPEQDTREKVIELYAQWLAPVADAPETLQRLFDESPQTRPLVEALREAEIDLGFELLQRYTMHDQLERSLRAEQVRESFGPKNLRLEELMNSEDFADAWEPLLAHVRRGVIEDEENMNPRSMIRYTRKYGPIDWRVPAAHGLYWAAQGVERGMARVRDTNEDKYDFVNTDRIVLQSIQDLWRYGTLYFNYIDYVVGGRGYYQNTPNEYFIPAYGELAKEIVERGGIFESEQRPMRSYASGYQNFLIDAVTFFYRRGEEDKAREWYRELRTFDEQNVHKQEYRIRRFSVPLDEFVQRELYDRFASPNVVTQEVTAALQGAYDALLRGENDRFRSQFEYAADAHAYFMSEQFREVLAARGGGQTRMEVLDRDFRYVAGNLFAQQILRLPPSEAVVLYSYAPDDLRRYAYEDLKRLYEPAIEEGRINLGDAFEVLFPEPPGMDRHRAYIRQKEAQRGGAIEGIQPQ